MAKAKISPMMDQYFQIKKDYADVILFFRLGDFYEMFFDDAKIASKELDLVLTGRDCGQEERAPMCGVPFHSADSYIAKLVSRGYKVAICEQMEDPALAKGIVKREVIRIITPGTVIEGNMLEDGVNNYLCSVFGSENGAGLCFADVSTGEFHVTLATGEDVESKVINQLSTYSPKEVIFGGTAADYEHVVQFVTARLEASAEYPEAALFDFDACSQEIIETLKKDEIAALDLGHSRETVCALGAVIAYLKNTQKKDEIETPSEVEFYDSERFMHLDISARRNLELTRSMMTGDKKHSLLWVIDKTKTAMGKRMIRAWVERPLLSVSQILRRQNAVGELFDRPMLRDTVRQALVGVNDIERLMTRIVYGTANAKELRALESTISALPEIKSALADCNTAMLREIESDIDLLTDVAEEIRRAIVEEPPFSIREGGFIRAGYNEEIDNLKAIMTDGTGVIASIEAQQREETGIPKLKVGYNRVFGYYIEVSNAYRDQVPETYIRKQTLTTGERYITQELKELENKILGAHERLIALEHRLFNELLESIGAQLDRIQRTANAVAELDVLAALAQVAAENNYCRPTVDESDQLTIVEGRHPVVEQMLKGSLFVPNDTTLNCGEDRCLIITGPNMAGKSTYMRQNALIALMAQIGSFVPARECHIGIVDRVFTRVGASDDLAAGQSTFMVEMTEVAEILKNATSRSLVVLDEIGRGTSTFDGMSIARAVVEYICDNIGCKTLFATHYHELTSMDQDVDGIKNYNIAVKKRGEDITFLRRIVQGPADDSYGIEVAKLAGLPEAVIKRAHAVLRQLEATAPGANKAMQLDFETVEAYNTPAVPSEVVDKLNSLDIETLTPIEALNFLYELKQALK